MWVGAQVVVGGDPCLGIACCLLRGPLECMVLGAGGLKLFLVQLFGMILPAHVRSNANQ